MSQEDEIRRLIEAQRPRVIISGSGVRGDGLNFSVESAQNFGPVPPINPDLGPAAYLLGWQVVWQFDTSTPPVAQWAVVLGKLKNTPGNIVNGDPTWLGVTGALTPGPIDPTDAAWSNIKDAFQDSDGNYLIWIEVAFGTWPAISSTYINTTNFNGGELEYAYDMSTPPNAIQTFTRKIIGTVDAFNSDGSPQLITQGYGILQLQNDGRIAFDNGGIGSNPEPCPVIYFP